MIRGSRRAWLACTTAVAALLLGLNTVAQAGQAASSENVETITVEGTRLQAKDIKRNAPVIVDIAPLEQIRSLPDINAAEALQRLPGISLESDTGEGRFINIRGMDADLNGTTYDGVRLMANNPSSPQNGARAVAFDAFPSGILGGVEVIKSLTPEIDAEGLGGVVNIQPRTIPEGKDHIFDASVGGGVETLRDKPVYKGDITLGKRFFNDKISIIASYGYNEDHRGIDDVEEDYAYANDGIDVPAGTSTFLAQKEFDNLQYRSYQYHRTRQGYGGGITYDVNNDTQLYLRGVHAGYTEDANKHEFILGNLGHNIASVDNTTGNYDATQAQAAYKDINTREQLGNDLVELGGKTKFGNGVKMDARASWTQGYDKWPYNITAKFSDPNSADVIYNNLNPKRPTYQTTGASSGVNLVDPANYTTASGGNSPTRNTDTEYAGVINVSLPLAFNDDGGVLKFGASIRDRTRKAGESDADLNFVSQSLTDYVSGPDIMYYNNEYNLGPQPIYSKLLSIPQSASIPNASTYADDSENVYAGYAQYNATFGKLDVIGGVRVERTEGTYRANSVDPNGNFLALNVDKHSYTNFFPDFSLKYRYSDALQFRLAYSTAIARPGFNQITAARSIDTLNTPYRIVQGNPDLKPTIGRNVDLYASYFLSNGGVISGGLFYKAFENYIISHTVNSTAVAGFVGTTVQLTTFQNIGSAHAEGVELDYNQQFEFLPGLLSGLGVEGNLTYVETRGEIRPGENHTLPQTSPFSYNAAVFYNKGPVYLKLAASYVSTNLWAVGGDPTTDQYSQARFRLDFGGSYDLTKRVQLYADVKNITNTHLQFTYTKSKSFPIQNEFYDLDVLGGVRVSF